MKLGRDFRKLGVPLLLLAFFVTVGVLLAQWGRTLEWQSFRERETTAARFYRAESRLRQVNDEAREIQEKSALFQRIAAHGIIGEERRLDWIELLQSTQEELRLPSMRYEFSPRAPLDLEKAGQAFYASPMRLHLEGMHEEDLLDFLARIQNKAPALVRVRNCLLARMEETRLGADCELDWITLRPEAPSS